MKENVEKISVAANGEILLQLASGGKPSYQYVYRAARGVYWDKKRQGFTFVAGSEEPNHWIEHILKVVEDELGIELVLPLSELSSSAKGLFSSAQQSLLWVDCCRW